MLGGALKGLRGFGSSTLKNRSSQPRLQLSFSLSDRSFAQSRYCKIGRLQPKSRGQRFAIGTSSRHIGAVDICGQEV